MSTPGSRILPPSPPPPPPATFSKIPSQNFNTDEKDDGYDCNRKICVSNAPNGNGSRASSSSGIDDLDFEIDPDAVDFEPLLVSGTGKILTYHANSYGCECEEEFSELTIGNEADISVSAKIGPPTNYANGHRSAFEIHQRKHQRPCCGTCCFPSGFESSSLNASYFLGFFYVQSYSFSSFLRLTTMIFIVAFIFIGSLSLFEFDASNYSLQTAVRKSKSSGISGINLFGGSGKNVATFGNQRSKSPLTRLDPMIEQNIIDIDVALSVEKISNIVLWHPFMEYSLKAERQTLSNVMGLVSTCTNRTVAHFQTDVKTQTYQLQPWGAISSRTKLKNGEPQWKSPLSENKSLMQKASLQNSQVTIVAPDIYEVSAIKFDSLHKGAFATIFYDPLYIYLEEHSFDEKVPKQLVEDLQEASTGVTLDVPATSNVEKNHSNRARVIDNVLVRMLAGVEEKRKINSYDFNIAKEILKSKFLIGTCDYPNETLRRFELFFNSKNISSGSIKRNERVPTFHSNIVSNEILGNGGGDQKANKQNKEAGRGVISSARSTACLEEKQLWEQDCRRRQSLQQLRIAENPQILDLISSKHQYDISLFEFSKQLFKEQQVLFY